MEAIMDKTQLYTLQRLEKELNISSNQTYPTGTHTINLLIKKLQGDVNAKRKKMRGKILYKLGLFGMTDVRGNLDFARINHYIKYIGSNNPKQKILNYLTCQELQLIVTQVDRMVDKELAKK